MLAGGPTVAVAPHLIKFHGLRPSYDRFCAFHQTILAAFCGNVELETHLEGSMWALFSSELGFPGSTSLILEGFRDLLERFLEIFCYLVLIPTSQ